MCISDCQLRLSFLGKQTYDVETEDLDPIVLFTHCCFFTSIELLSFPYKISKSLGGRKRGLTNIFTTLVTSHGKGGHESDSHLRIFSTTSLSPLDLGRIIVRREAIC